MLSERLARPVIAGVKDLGERVREAPDKVRTGTRLSRQSGFLWVMTSPGLVEMVKALASGSQNPSLLYRIHAKNSPTKPALVWRGRTTTWIELDSRIDRFASGLVRRGVGKKERLVVMLKNRQEMVELGAAAVRAKAATVAISWRSTAQELVYLANHSGAKGMVIEPELLPVYEQAKAELRPGFFVLVAGKDAPPGATPLDDLLDEEPQKIETATADEDDGATIIYTSGTTGKPKGAVRKYPKDTMFAAFRFINETPMRVDDVHLVTAPLYHSTAFGFLALSHILGNTAVIMDHFDPETFLRLVDEHRVSTAAVVPTMLHRVLELPPETRRKYDTRSLRALFSGGAPLPAPVATEFMDAFGDVVFNFYGATETGLVTLAKPQDLRDAPGTIGKVIPGNEIRLLDDDKREVAEGQVGELFVKNKLLVAGYHDDDQATNDSMVTGFFTVGDLARRDRDGNYFIEGRKRDMVISGGVNVYPAEVEGVLESHPGISEVAVVGVPDREWGERVRAFVVRREGSMVDEGALKLFARERLSGPKVPRDFVFVDELPRNPTGKVLKRELVKWVPSRAHPGT
jgi:fatty-acyl-CoA synthase